MSREQLINFGANLTRHNFVTRIERTHNNTYKKLGFQWLYEALCFYSSSLLSDSFVLRNRQLLVAAKRYKPF